jgi:hypothetical protein
VKALLRLLGVLAVVLIGASATATTAVHAAAFTYDLSPIARVVTREIGAGGLGPTLLLGAREESVSPSVEGRDASTTTANSVVATSSAPLVSRGADVTEEVIREAMRGAPLSTTQASGVSLPKIQRFVDRLLAGERAPAIKVDGSRIVDGNHRYIASRIAGVDVDCQEWTGSPRSTVPWDELPVDSVDWGD